MKLKALAPQLKRKSPAKPVAGRAATRSGGLWALLGAGCGAVVATVLWAPASWLAWGVQYASQGKVELLNPSGTVWHGEAALVLAAGHSGRDRLTLPSRVQWRWQWQWQQGPQLAIASPCCTTQPVAVRVGWRGVQLPAGGLQLPMAWLQGLGAPWNTLGLRGVLAVHWQDMRWARTNAQWGLQGALEVQARHVATTLTTLPDVGSYRLRITTGAQPTLALDTLRGALVLEGQGRWRSGRFQFQGEGRAQPEQAAALANLLTLLGNKQGNTTKIRWG